jgi:flavin-binding protein dodecin
MTAVTIRKILRITEESWEDAAEQAAMEADRTIEHSNGIEVESWTAQMDDGELSESGDSRGLGRGGDARVTVTRRVHTDTIVKNEPVHPADVRRAPGRRYPWREV